MKRSLQVTERQENGVRIRVMAPDPQIAKNREVDRPMSGFRDDSRSAYQNYRRRELEAGRW